MQKQISEIAARIRELREVCGYSVERLADELNIDVETYKEYESCGDNIPISVIYEISAKFGVDFTEIITGVVAKLDTYHIVKNGEGKSVTRFAGYIYEDLAFRYNHKLMQPLIVTLCPSDEPTSLVTHSGQEFNIVMEGSIAVAFDDKEFILNKGDSIYFNPLHPHSQKCVGDTKAKFLTVIAE